MRSFSSNKPKLVECTNKNKGIWVIRWHVEQQDADGEGKTSQYVYQEERFTHAPTFQEAVGAIMASGADAAANELVEIAEVTGEDLEAAKKLVQSRIDMYDKSDKVNIFSVNGMDMWLDKQTRTSLSYTISVEEQAGNEQTTLWYEGLPPVNFTLRIEQLKQMLSALELYAKATYNVTQDHKSRVCRMTTVNEVLNFDITSDYPDKLAFTI